MEVDASRPVHLFLHGRADLRERAVAALESAGFPTSRISDASPARAGAVGDYMAMLWMPPSPDHIRIQRITAVDPSASPEGMAGVWTGVSKDDLFTVRL